LIVVMRHHGLLTTAVDGLMVGVQSSEVTPTILVDHLTFGKEGIRALDDIVDVLRVPFVALILAHCKPRNHSQLLAPERIDTSCQGVLHAWNDRLPVMQTEIQK